MPEKSSKEHAIDMLRKTEETAKERAKQFRQEAKSRRGRERADLLHHAQAHEVIAGKAHKIREKYR